MGGMLEGTCFVSALIFFVLFLFMRHLRHFLFYALFVFIVGIHFLCLTDRLLYRLLSDLLGKNGLSAVRIQNLFFDLVVNIFIYNNKNILPNGKKGK